MIHSSSQLDADSPFSSNSGVHKYKYKAWVILQNLFSLVFIGFAFVLPLAVLLTTIMTSAQRGTNEKELPILLLCIPAVLIVPLGVLIIQLVINFISTFFSYLKISPDGIENRIWPYRHIRARWSEVDRLGTFLLYDFLSLKSFEVAGLSLSYIWPLKYLNFLSNKLMLTGYSGWPKGQLHSDLKRYAPQLFEEQPVEAHTQAPAIEASLIGVSQEQRLLAALSHGAVLFAGIGILVPILIYSSQKNKSSFLAIQAWQAFLYQLIGVVFSFFFPMCVFGVIFLYAWMASAARNADPNSPSYAMNLVVIFALVLAGILGNLTYILYGIAGAIMAFLGKDFRYVLIGKRIQN